MRHRDKYYYIELRNGDYVSDYTVSDPYNDEGVKSYDDMLHQALSEIFCERCNLSSDHIKELLADQDFTLKLILEKNSALSRIFPRKIKLPLLWIAVLNCYQNSAELLVRSGADVNERCFCHPHHFEFIKWTILQLLVQMYPSSWNERFIDLVVDHGADLQAVDTHGETVLHYAVTKSRVRVTELFLEKGTNVNATDKQGKTPLLTAACCCKNADEIVRLLMKHGADVTVRDDSGRNALHYLPSAPTEHADLAKVLIKKDVSLDDRTRNFQMQPIHEAAFMGKNELVKVFLDHGSDVNARESNGETPLFYAASCDNPAVLLTLLKRGANVDLKTTDGSTALHTACDTAVGKDYRNNIKILLSVGMDMCVENNAGKTALATLARYNFGIEKNSSIGLMLMTLALRKACLPQPSNKFKDSERIIEQQYPNLWTYYQDCVKHIYKTKSMRLIYTYTLFDLLTKCPCQIATLLYNRKVEKNFKRYDLQVFSATYAEDIRMAFERAKLYHHSTLEQENVINEAVHNILPWQFVRKVACYTVGCEECELKKIVRVSKTNAYS